MNHRGHRSLQRSSRREFLGAALALGGILGGARLGLGADEVAQLPFENGERPLVAYPQKRPLLRLTTRPPQLETPFSVFNESLLTPNDAFFVRYHLTNSPPPEEKLAPETFRLRISGTVGKELSLSVADLKSQFETVEVTAVNQCSGNGRGLFQPRMPGGQSGNGMMGNARWRGVRLKDVLNRAGVGAGARQVTFNGLDSPLLPQTPDFVKALDVDQALDGEVLLAYEMNGEELPWLNGYPLRLVVPGYYGTYWIKHLNDIKVIDDVFKGFWMSTAYRIPDNPCACVPPGTKPSQTVPINRLNVRSFITSLADGAKVRVNERLRLRGFAFDGGSGIKEVVLSSDNGSTWVPMDLGEDKGKYAFREWTGSIQLPKAGAYVVKARATSHSGQTQPLDPSWNPSGYMRNVVEAVNINAA
ncbi:MAG TPA: molybdopterin-dependent oxidoreductase [Candidatus Limnocylindria bacterium]|jgi:DMSO/TMAO reductase YedYZ molybdopterin-dependent catalytic subunit|nr:molybdopterin-dependent oxidoreductase [Candidatus Limnocylindria bacterium]